MFEIHIGSTLLKEPDKKYIDKSYLYSEWNIDLEELRDEDKVMVVKKTYLNKPEKLRLWLDVFAPLFPKEIMDDSRRIAYDLKFDGPITNCSPSLCAISCMFLSCLFHEHEFDSKMNMILAKKNEGLELFGLKRRRYKEAEKTPFMIKKYAKIIMANMPEKFTKLERMWKVMEGIK